jgi:uncharacterized protein YjbJ (UPF0337 family)
MRRHCAGASTPPFMARYQANRIHPKKLRIEPEQFPCWGLAQAWASGPGYSTLRRTKMNWDTVKGDWKQVSGKVKEQWGKLTDDELTQINGNREQLEGKIQAKYGYAKDKAKKEVDDWLNRP